MYEKVLVVSTLALAESFNFFATLLQIVINAVKMPYKHGPFSIRLQLTGYPLGTK